jgi:hypothetical protein
LALAANGIHTAQIAHFKEGKFTEVGRSPVSAAKKERDCTITALGDIPITSDGIDPHEGSHTAVMIGSGGSVGLPDSMTLPQGAPHFEVGEFERDP